MPYISAKDERRKLLRDGEPALTAGELNYQIFYYIKHYYDKDSTKVQKIIITDFIIQFLNDEPNYQKYNDITGCLIRCYKEVKRRLKLEVHLLIKIMESYDNEIAIYEDKKIGENGDVE